jgi:hypothetical protein
MAYFRLALKPGVDKQNTEYGAEGGWIDSDYIRFRYGLPEKIGGWQYFDNAPIALVGGISEVLTWTNNLSIPYTMVGTTRKLYVLVRDVWTDITPIRKNSTGVTFTTTSGSNVVTVNDLTNGAVPGDFVTFSNVTGDPGGIPNADLEHEFEIQEIVSPSAYTILAPTNASSSDTGAGTADAEYQINVGQDVDYFDYGWGVATWGLSTWGTPRPEGTSETSLVSRVWQFDNYGQNVICQIVDGPTYYWDESVRPIQRAQILAGAPTKSTFALVSTPDRHLVCFGTETTIGSPTTQDPMFVRFSNQEDISNFQETATNTAGGQRLTDGNRIVSAVRSRGQILIFTSNSLHGMQFLGPPYTFGFQQLGANCGCVGPHAAVDVNGLAFWMGPEAFYAFDGTVKKLPCTVQDYVFKDINLVQRTKFHAGVNSQFNEVTWWYCSFTSDYIDRFVTYNYLENVWSVGSMARSAWVDLGTYDKPIAGEYFPESDAAYDVSTIYGLTEGRTFLYFQETGDNAIDQPIHAYIQSGYFDIGDGDNMVFMSKFIPDFKNQRGNLTVRLLLRPYPQAGASPSSLDPYVITPTTQKVDTRARGRQISLTIDSNEVNTNWRFGTLRVDVQPDGLR